MRWLSFLSRVVTLALIVIFLGSALLLFAWLGR